MARVIFLFLVTLSVSVYAGCEWYQNCGACVADSGCGWCSNDPTGVGTGQASGDGQTVNSVRNDGTIADIASLRTDSKSDAGVSATSVMTVAGQSESVASVGASKAVLSNALIFEGTGYVATPYFGQTAGGAQRNMQIVGVQKTRFTTELKAQYTITPYMMGTFTISSVQSDTQATLTSFWSQTFQNLEFQIGNIPSSGLISYPNTDKQDVYGSWPPNPTKFTTELKNGYTIKCTRAGCGGLSTDAVTGKTVSIVRIKHIYNDQHLYVDPRFTESFSDTPFAIDMGPRGSGLVSGTASNTRMDGSDPCRTSNNEPCYEETRFLSELRIGDIMSINSGLACTAPSTTCRQDRTISMIQDDYHLSFTTALSAGLIGTTSKFKIKSFHARPFTYARSATGALAYVGGTSTTVTGSASATFTKNLMAGYRLRVKIPDATDPRGYHFESRDVKSINSATSMTIDSPFTAPFGVTGDLINAGTTTYNYASCPSLAYENFDLRTENGLGLISNDGTNWVYDNVQYSKVVTDAISTGTVDEQPALFQRQLKVGFTLQMDGITRTVTKIVSDTLLFVDRAFQEGVQYTDYSYRYSVRKSGDFHMHWKPSVSLGDYDQVSVASDSKLFSRQLISPQTASNAIALVQDPYLLYPPVCYNTGRCVPKTSHSLRGVELDGGNARVISSTPFWASAVNDMVTVASTTPFFSDCKPVCTVTIGAQTGSTWQFETRRLYQQVNATHMQTEIPFNLIPSGATDRVSRVRYVTGTGTITAGVAAGMVTTTVTGASKETKTKFNSELSSFWSITIGCGGATCSGQACTTDADCAINQKVTGGKCVASICTAETQVVNVVTSDTRLQTSTAFTQSYNKVDYTIGNIPGLGSITNSQNSKTVDGDTNTRFLEQLKVGYTIKSMGLTRTITAISSNLLMTVSTAFDTPGITTPTSYTFSGKKGTGEVSVDATATPQQVDGTLDVTQTQFLNELALGYMFMVGDDYKVVTGISSNTVLTVDTPFGGKVTTPPNFVYSKNDYNYESCWLALNADGGVTTSVPAGTDATYTNKKVYVEDACEIKPGCCGFKLSSVVYPDRFAYYKIRPSHTNMNIRVVVKTTEDNVDLVVKKSAVPTTSSFDYKSVRESNPWALTIPNEVITCPSFVGQTSSHVPSNCDYWYIGVRGDNRYPQKTGASEYDLYVYTEFDWPNFVCSDAKSDQGDNKCKWLGIMKNADANMVTNDDQQAVMRLTPATNQRKGSIFYTKKLHLYNGFETSFSFRMTGFSVGCNSVLYPSGFCGGGDGFAFVIQATDDNQIGCTGSGLGFAGVKASKQGNDWARTRCVAVDGGSATNTCDTNDDGTFSETCVVGALCAVTGALNGGCGTTGSCSYQDCTSSISQLLAIEFDTWNNLALHDPKQGVSRWWINATEFVGYNDNHVAIFSSNGQLETDHALNEHFAATPSIPNLADGKNHTVKIKYWPSLNDPAGSMDGSYNRTNRKLRGAVYTDNIPVCGDCLDDNGAAKLPTPDDCYQCVLQNNRPGNLAVFIDDMKRPVLQTEISLRKSNGQGMSINTCFDDNRDRCILDEIGNAYMGFTAATGGERAGGRDPAGNHIVSPSGTTATSTANGNAMLGAAQNHEILDWSFCNYIGCVEI